MNHELHNLDFFYALLVTERHEGRSGLDRYAVRHYVLFRGDDGVYELGPAEVRVTDEARIWPKDRATAEQRPRSDGARRDRALAVRAQDQTVLGVMFPALKPRLFARSGTFFWKGPLPLVDGTEAHLRVVEVGGDDGLAYYPRVSPASAEAAELCETPFGSASAAARALELRLNRAIYESAAKQES